ncbi:hypothetical protein SAMN02910456_00624 [Ruminococcaceae bacterium YRB3002]|nr:hypothetical protein SAMN02910456_00624 [Ruminococcaceae bacterium YRB3002]
MCKYCDNLYSGNSCECLNLSDIAMNGVDILGSMSYLTDKDDGLVYLETVVMDCRGEIITHCSIKIGWCPVCGNNIKSNMNNS